MDCCAEALPEVWVADQSHVVFIVVQGAIQADLMPLGKDSVCDRE
jgi:hypothetical protein